ncbi:MAG: HupE/UreJ family protein, partial [Gammaproteobacteria bacterium]
MKDRRGEGIHPAVFKKRLTRRIVKENVQKAFLWVRLILFVMPCFWPPGSAAHEPGLSAAQIEAGETEITVTLSFALRDLKMLKALESDEDLEALRSAEEGEVTARILEGAFLEVNGERMPGTLRSRSVDGADGLRLAISYPDHGGHSIRYRWDLFGAMALGHRQIVTWREQGKGQGTALLSAQAPDVLFTREEPSAAAGFLVYLGEGVRHIWIGFDHILFLLSLLLPAAMIRRADTWLPCPELPEAFSGIFRIVTAFTLAHSITLTLAVLDCVRISPALVESLIALSVIL